MIFRYVCERRRDGISKIGPFGDEEGSDEPEVSYDCDGEGNYTFERENITNEIILPKCLERRKPFIRNHQKIRINQFMISIFLFHRCSEALPMSRILQ